MRALLYQRALELVVTDVPEPVVGPGETIVTVEAVGICGSEVEGFASQSPFRKPPLVMGHEFAGRRGTDDALVAVNPLIACGRCRTCATGRTNICENGQILGIHRAGGFAERVAVPAANCYLLPPGITALQGAFVEPLANGVHATRLVDAELDAARDVGIIGSGMLGLAVLVALQARGTTADIADLNEPRAALAARLGARKVGPRLDGAYDVVFDTVGTAGTRAASVAQLRAGGIAVWLGLHEAESDVDCRAMIRRENAVRGSFCYTGAEFAEAVPLASNVGEDWLQRVDLASGVEVFAQLMRGPSDHIKTILVP